MVRVEVLRPLTVRYVYRTSWELQGAELRQHVDTDLRLAITANNCADAAVRWAIDQDVTMRHDYHGPEMEYIGTVRVDRWDCRRLDGE